MSRVGDRRILAAGGVVWRAVAGGPVEVLVVHRGRRADWSLPKGKPDRGEGLEQTALREVREETGWECSLGRSLGGVTYTTPEGDPKAVFWWVMTPGIDHGLVPGPEVSERQWWTVPRAFEELGYPTDHEVLRRFVMTASPSAI